MLATNPVLNLFPRFSENSNIVYERSLSCKGKSALDKMFYSYVMKPIKKVFFVIVCSFPIRYFGESRSTITIQPKFGAISMTEFSRQEIPLEGSYIAPLMSIFDVPFINSDQDDVVGTFFDRNFNNKKYLTSAILNLLVLEHPLELLVYHRSRISALDNFTQITIVTL
jgi:hypothetical protein